MLAQQEAFLSQSAIRHACHALLARTLHLKAVPTAPYALLAHIQALRAQVAAVVPHAFLGRMEILAVLDSSIVHSATQGLFPAFQVHLAAKIVHVGLI